MSGALSILQTISEILQVAPGLLAEIGALIALVKGAHSAVPAEQHPALRQAFVAAAKAGATA